jgi:hypothetical protein
MRYNSINPPQEYQYSVLVSLVMNDPSGWSLPSINDWCNDNNIDFWVQPMGQLKHEVIPNLHTYVYFKHEEDAMAFKLVWL